MKIRPNFIYPEITDSERLYGVSLGTVVREDGDWRSVLPPNEEQRQRGVESSACYIEAQQAAIAIIQEERFKLPDQNYSARFNALLSEGSEVGGDPIKGAKSIKNDGLVPQEVMPWDGIDSWEEFHSWEGVDEAKVRQKGKMWLDQWSPKYKIVVERELPIETKYVELREALKRSPVPISVCAWYERNGVYYKPMGKRDNHLTLAIYIDKDDRIYVRDTYAPYMKILEPKTNFEFALTWALERKPYEQQLSLLQKIVTLLAQWVSLKPEPVRVPLEVKYPIPEPSKRERIYEEAKGWLGKDASPQDRVPDEVACAESVCNVLTGVYPDFPLITGTWTLFEHLKKDSRFKITTEIKEGNIIISPTGYGYGVIRGHAGIISEEGIMSNSSNTGLWSENYTMESWVARYRVKGGFPVVIFEAV